MSEREHHFILRYLEGTQTPEEKDEFDAWVNASPDNLKLVDSYRKIWAESKGNDEPEFDAAEGWNKFTSAVNLDEESTRLGTWGFAKLAAAILALIISSSLVYFFLFSNRLIEIQAGETAIQTTLPDGSQVWLNDHSSVSYSADFSEKRSINMVGEAFFDVKPDREHPFTITTGEGTVKVLGTSFNVNATSGDSISVFVVSGKVSMSMKQSIELTTGQQGVMSPGNSPTLMTVTDPNEVAWKTKQLVFSKDKLENVVRRLQTYFKTDIRISNDTLAACRFTGSFDDPTLNEVLETLGFALDVKVQLVNNEYLLTGNGCNSN